MQIIRAALVLFILTLALSAVVESRTKQKGRYKLFKSRLNHRLPQEEARQHRDELSYNSKDKLPHRNSIKEDDYEDIEDELNNLNLDNSNRIFFNKYQATTQAPVPEPLPPPPPPDATPPEGPPAPPAPARSYRIRPSRYRDFDF